MRKKLGRAIAIMLALLLTGSAFVDYYVSARAENTAEGITEGPEEGKQEEKLEVSITINGKDISEVTTIHQDDAIEISINWIISDDELGELGPDGNRQVKKEITLTPSKNVNIPDMDERELRDTNNREIGYVTIKNNVVTMVINEDSFLSNEKGRRAKGVIEGTIDAGGESHKTGDKVPVQIGDYVNEEFVWDNNEDASWLTISKSAGNLSYDSENGKWVQTYTIEISNYGGPSTITEIADIPGSGLENWQLLNVESNLEDTELTITGQQSSLEEILKGLKGLTVKENEKITLTYTMEVFGGAESVFTDDSDQLKNTLSGKWTSNKQQEWDFNLQVGLNVTKPKVNKAIVAGSTDEEQTWEITIDLGDAAKAGMTLEEVVTQINEDPGTGLIYNEDQQLSASDFTETSPGSGIYKARITTTLEPEYKKSESTVVKNRVKIKTKYWPDEIPSNEAPYTTTGKGESTSISKRAVGYDETTGKITWEVVLNGLPTDAENVKVSDWVGEGPWGKTWGDHSLLKTLKVDGKTVIKEGEVTEDGRGIIQTEYSGDYPIDYTTLKEVYFLNDFIKANGGKDITLTYVTEVADKTAMKGVWFFNKATLEYTTKGTTKYPEASAEYHYATAADDALTKTGAADDDEETITYTLTIDMDKVSVDAEGNGAIVITDELVQGNGLVYVEDSAKIVDMIGDWPLKNDSRTYYDPQDKVFWRDYTSDSDRYARSYPMSGCLADVTTRYEKNENELTFTIPAEKLAIKKAYRDYIEEQDNYSPAYTLVITYKMKVEDVTEFVKNGQPVTYVNQANGTSNGQSLNRSDHPATTTNTLTPEDVIDKTGQFIEENANHEHNTVEFTVDVNPGARDLSEGSLTAIDRLSKDLTYDLTTIHVYEVDGSIEPHELNQGSGDDEYSFVFDPFKNWLTFTLPDAKHLQITYVAKANVFRGSGDPEKKITIENSFELQGYSSSNMEDSVSFQAAAVEDRWLATSEKGSIQLYKYWNNGSGMQAVIGSVFEVYGTKTGADGQLAVDKEKRINADQEYRVSKETTTNDYGGVTINNLDYNICYALVEVEGGHGINGEPMAVQEKPYFFVIEGSDITLNNVPANCTKFVGGGFLYYPNEEQEEQTDTGVIKIIKTWKEETNKLSSWDDIKDSLQFVIKDEKGEVIKTCSGADLHRVGDRRYESKEYKVPLGTYTVVETNSTIQDFDVETTYVIESGNAETSGSGTTTGGIYLQTADEGVTVVYTNIYSYTGPFAVKVSKRSLTGTDEIAGAFFKLSGGSLSSDVFWISGKEPYVDKPYEFKLKPGKYKLTEIQAPQGYKRAKDEIEFTVEKNGKITITQGSETDNMVGNDTVVMRDEPLDVEVRKIAIVEGDTIGVAGATLTLYDKADLDNHYNLRPDQEALYEWTSKAGESEPIGKYLYASVDKLNGDKRTYVLVETKVPENGGYGYSKKIEFKVSETGEIYDVKYVGDSEMAVATEKTTADTEGNRILMEDKVISVWLSKVDLQGNTINGQATISVYKKADIDEATGNPLPGKDAIETFTFGNGNDLHKFGSKLLPGEKYVFVETGVPDGYKRADYIEFEVAEDGTVKVYGGVEQKDNAYLMYDAKEDEALVSLVIYKTVSGELTLNEINGDLKFRVEQVPGDGETYDEMYGETFTIAKDFAKDEENGRYVLRLSNLPLGTYKVTEIYEGTTPNDMKLEVSYTIDSGSEEKDLTPNNRDFETENIPFTADGEQHTVTYNNNYQYRKGTIKLTKSLEFVGSALDWKNIVAEKLNFHIYKVVNPGGPDERKEEIARSPVSGSSLSWNDTDQVYEFMQPVPVGTYIVEEKYEHIDGYVMTTTHTVNAKADTASVTAYETSKQMINEDSTLEVGYNNKYVQNHPVAISKRDITNGEELAKVTWEITGETWEESPITPIRWTTKEDTTTGKVEPHEVTLQPGEYTLTEITAPIGYKKTAPITFKLDDNGDITIPSEQTNALDNNTVILWDAPLDVEVDKVTLGGGAEVKGATLYLYDDEGHKLAEHISDENEVWQIGEYLQLGGKYRLVEELAPNGYGCSAHIEFTVGDDGNIKDVKYIDESKKVELRDTKDGAAGTTPGNKILMEDRAISIKLNKVELGSTTKELEGAVIGIYDAEAVDANGRLINPDTKPLEAWNSEIGGCHEFGTKLEAERNYVFVETAAPDGYQLAPSIRFTIKKDGSVENVSLVTGETVMTTRDEEDTVYLMEDGLNTDPHATLVLAKSIEGEGISPADITKTNLRFHVESMDVSTAYDQVFYVGGVGFEWDGEKYVQHIYNLKPGRYMVTELWDDSAASGIVCTGQTWEMVLTGASGIGSIPGTGAATGEFNLEDGDTIEVNYTNTYKNGGTLIITKTIAGAFTKEEAEKTLTFTVTENTTNKKDTYTLKDDFVYNSETKQWTKELALTAGGYTVKESVKTPGGKTCTTTYAVTGGTSRNGVGTQVQNVVLEKGGTTTVAYTNTYTKDNSDDGDSSETTEIDKNVVTTLTKTGDDAPIGVWLLMLEFGVIGVFAGGYALSRRKKKD